MPSSTRRCVHAAAASFRRQQPLAKLTSLHDSSSSLDGPPLCRELPPNRSTRFFAGEFAASSESFCAFPSGLSGDRVLKKLVPSIPNLARVALYMATSLDLFLANSFISLTRSRNAAGGRHAGSSLSSSSDEENPSSACAPSASSSSVGASTGAVRSNERVESGGKLRLLQSCAGTWSWRNGCQHQILHTECVGSKGVCYPLHVGDLIPLGVGPVQFLDTATCHHLSTRHRDPRTEADCRIHLVPCDQEGQQSAPSLQFLIAGSGETVCLLRVGDLSRCAHEALAVCERHLGAPHAVSPGRRLADANAESRQQKAELTMPAWRKTWRVERYASTG
eukprot:2632122-Rhodomonas_salina.4